MQDVFTLDGGCNRFASGGLKQWTGKVLQFLPLRRNVCSQEELLCGKRGSRPWGRGPVTKQKLSSRAETVATDLVACTFQRVLKRG